jgi:two-component system sensor histidine kinase KdpD
MPKRLEPDEILKQIVKLSTGRHKIYLGMAPGVGKTCKMLEEARDLKKKGIDIVIGYIENQGRSDNNTLIGYFESIPKKCFKINGKDFFELDVEAVIERRPATVIIDELAHSNIPGSLNQKRYEDVQEILKNGISVLSTLNIHHLESIAPIIEKNLGIKINETIPDWVLNQANETVLIDIPIDDLHERLKSKNIYSQDQLKHAYKNFFKRSNLFLLRDLALNVLAERVDIEVVSEKLKAKIKDRILVACKPELNSNRLIKHAGIIASITHGDLDVLCILNEKVEESITTSLRESTKEYKGNFFLIKDLKKSIADELVHFVKLNRITQVVMGHQKEKKIKELFSKTTLFDLMGKTTNLDILIVGSNEEEGFNILNKISDESTIQKQEKHNFGKLKIHIGMAPGVGKTYKMLQDARALHDQGKNVLLGVIDTHGRPETSQMMAEMPLLPQKLIQHKEKYMQEFDLEGAILAKPEYILVDELAHTNVPGSINNKRYQDVQYLLRAGINVMSTVNIQHIESLNDIVEQVTGIKVRETVPDWIISHASEIVLIDLSPEALQERLKAGKIYSLDKIEQALTHFFQKRNLIALRELSLREVAESVEHELYPKNKKGKILSLIDINSDTLRLIRKSARLASRLQSELIVMHIIKEMKKLSEEKKIAIIELEQLIVELGGDFRLVESEHIVDEIVNAEKKIKPSYVVIGEPTRDSKSIFTESITKEILKRISNPHIWIVGDFTRESND